MHKAAPWACGPLLSTWQRKQPIYDRAELADWVRWAHTGDTRQGWDWVAWKAGELRREVVEVKVKGAHRVRKAAVPKIVMAAPAQ
jgi:hypothetical protein